MPTTYSPSLRISLYGDGEQAGVWGQGTNLNLGTLLESAISGRIQVPVTTANVTLTANNGTDDQARHMAIELTGASTSSYSIICPSVDKMYLVWNNTTGGFTHHFRTLAGTGVFVPAGKYMLVWCDGVNVQEAINHVTTLLPIAGGTMLGAISMPGGTVSIPSLNFAVDTNTGIWRIGADTLGIATGGTNRVSVGVADTAITNNLTVAGTSTLTGVLTANNNLSVAGTTLLQSAVSVTSTLNTTGTVSFASHCNIGTDATDLLVVDATSTFNGPVTFAGVPTFTGNVVIGDSGADTLGVVSTSTFTGAATFNGVVDINGATTVDGALTLSNALNANGANTFGGTATFSNTATFNAALVANGNVTLGNATGDVITVTGNTTVGSGTSLTKQSAGSFISHGSSSYASGVITVSASSPSGGSDGDIWFQT